MTVDGMDAEHDVATGDMIGWYPRTMLIVTDPDHGFDDVIKNALHQDPYTRLVGTADDVAAEARADLTDMLECFTGDDVRDSRRVRAAVKFLERLLDGDDDEILGAVGVARQAALREEACDYDCTDTPGLDDDCNEVADFDLRLAEWYWPTDDHYVTGGLTRGSNGSKTLREYCQMTMADGSTVRPPEFAALYVDGQYRLITRGDVDGLLVPGVLKICDDERGGYDGDSRMVYLIVFTIN